MKIMKKNVAKSPHMPRAKEKKYNNLNLWQESFLGDDLSDTVVCLLTEITYTGYFNKYFCQYIFSWFIWNFSTLAGIS